MATKATRATSSAARRHVRCYLCGHVSEVSHKALSSTCPNCHKAIKIEDVVVKNYLPVNDVQTCGTITVTKKGRIAAKRIQAGDGVYCDGTMEGKLETAGPVQLGSSANWKGAELFSASLSVEEGATLVGYVAVPCVVSPTELVEKKELVRHVDPAEVNAEEHAESAPPLFDVAEEKAPTSKPLPKPKVISTRKAALDRVAEPTAPAQRAEAPLPKPNPRPKTTASASKPAETKSEETPKPAATRKPASTTEPKPAPARKKKKTTTTKTSSTSTEKASADAPAKAPKVISTRKAALERAASTTAESSAGSTAKKKKKLSARTTKAKRSTD